MMSSSLKSPSILHDIDVSTGPSSHRAAKEAARKNREIIDRQRAERLQQALRENLKKRKEQMRARIKVEE